MSREPRPRRWSSSTRRRDMVIKRVEPTSCAKVAGLVYAILGVVAGVIVALIPLFREFVTGHPPRTAFGTFLGAGAIVVFPILYGVAGFVTALISAWLYNLVAGWVGGVEVDIQ